jgi:hypothetical protein
MNDALKGLFSSFQHILPQVTNWIEEYIAIHKKEARHVLSFGFKRLGDYFSTALLARSRVVFVERVILPPLSTMGLTFFGPFEQTPYSGITYKDTFFLAPEARHSESTWFHEMVHIVQWDELTPEPFLITYAVGLLTKGYRDSPLEAMAYDLQTLFDNHQPIADIDALVRNPTRIISESASEFIVALNNAI